MIVLVVDTDEVDWDGEIIHVGGNWVDCGGDRRGGRIIDNLQIANPVFFENWLSHSFTLFSWIMKLASWYCYPYHTV